MPFAVMGALPVESHLSDREKEILRLVAAGMTNREIAQRLTISPNTVKVHLSNIFEKLDVMSRTEATLYAIEHRIVDVPGGEIVAAQPPGLGPFLRQFTWVWVALGLLLVTFLVTLGSNMLFPADDPDSESFASLDIAERWQELAPMPEPRAGMAAVAYDGNIYAIAGEGPEGVSGSVFRYLTAEDRWETLSDKPTPVTDVEGVVIGEKVYIPGGTTAGGQSTTVLEIYDPRRDTWETGAPLPTPVSAYALVDFEGKLYLFGGWDGEKALDMVWIYEPGGDNWQAGAQLAGHRYDAQAVALTDRIVVLGGRDEGGALKSAWSYFPSRDGGGEDPWERFADLPEARYGFGAASIYESVYLLGGAMAGQGETGLVKTGENWVPLPANRDYSARDLKLVTLDSQLFVIEPEPSLGATKAWLYQAFYYSIFIPIVQ